MIRQGLPLAPSMYWARYWLQTSRPYEEAAPNAADNFDQHFFFDSQSRLSVKSRSPHILELTRTVCFCPDGRAKSPFWKHMMLCTWHFNLSLLFTAIYLITAATCQAGDKDKPDSIVPRFIYPSREGMQFFSQDTVNVSYHSDYENPTLYFWCTIGKTNNQLGKLEDFPSDSGWYFVRMPSGVDSDNCWFNLKAAEGEIKSVSFGLSSSEPTNAVVGPEAVESTASSSVEASETEAPTTSTRQTAPSTTPSNTSQTSLIPEEEEEDGDLEDQEPKALSTGVKVGIAASISLGVIGIAVLATIFANLRKRKRANSTEGVGSHQGSIHMIQGHQMAVHPGTFSPGAESNLAHWCQGSNGQYKLKSQTTLRYELP
ncbi:hypothetical protein CC79DRAFT_1392891 [Sarocladium strictum]